MARPKDPKTAEKEALVAQYIQEGKTGPEISAITGISASYITKIKKRLQTNGIDLSPKKVVHDLSDEIEVIMITTTKQAVKQVKGLGHEPTVYASKAFHDRLFDDNALIERKIQERLAEMKLHGEKRSKGVPNLCPSCMSIALKTNVYSKLWHCKDCENTGMFSASKEPVIFEEGEFYLEELDSMVEISLYADNAGEYSVGDRMGTFSIDWETLAVTVDETSAGEKDLPWEDEPSAEEYPELPKWLANSPEAVIALANGNTQKALNLLQDRQKARIEHARSVLFSIAEEIEQLQEV